MWVPRSIQTAEQSESVFSKNCDAKSRLISTDSRFNNSKFSTSNLQAAEPWYNKVCAARRLFSSNLICSTAEISEKAHLRTAAQIIKYNPIISPFQATIFVDNNNIIQSFLFQILESTGMQTNSTFKNSIFRNQSFPFFLLDFILNFITSQGKL
jgi:hypothetical protein